MITFINSNKGTDEDTSSTIIYFVHHLLILPDSLIPHCHLSLSPNGSKLNKYKNVQFDYSVIKSPPSSIFMMLHFVIADKAH